MFSVLIAFLCCLCSKFFSEHAKWIQVFGGIHGSWFPSHSQEKNRKKNRKNAVNHVDPCGVSLSAFFVDRSPPVWQRWSCFFRQDTQKITGSAHFNMFDAAVFFSKLSYILEVERSKKSRHLIFWGSHSNGTRPCFAWAFGNGRHSQKKERPCGSRSSFQTFSSMSFLDFPLVHWYLPRQKSGIFESATQMITGGYITVIFHFLADIFYHPHVTGMMIGIRGSSPHGLTITASESL